MGIADCLGVTIAGSRDATVSIVDRAFSGLGGKEMASLIPPGTRRPIDTAVLVNGVAAHVLDYDDVTLDGLLDRALVIRPLDASIGNAQQTYRALAIQRRHISRDDGLGG